MLNFFIQTYSSIHTSVLARKKVNQPIQVEVPMELAVLPSPTPPSMDWHEFFKSYLYLPRCAGDGLARGKLCPTLVNL